MSSSTKGRYSVYVVTLPAGAKPQTPYQTPDVFSGAEVYARKLPAYAALGFALTFNKHQLAERIPDLKWAIPVAGRLADAAPFDAWAMKDQKAARADRRPIVTGETFQRVYDACSAAELPKLDGIDPADWWRALLILTRTTGLGYATLLGLRTADVDWQARRLAVSPEADSPAPPRVIPLSESAAEHLLKLRGDREELFHWPHSADSFYATFGAVQEAAGIAPQDRFGFDELRRACAAELAQGAKGGAA